MFVLEITVIERVCGLSLKRGAYAVGGGRGHSSCQVTPAVPDERYGREAYRVRYGKAGRCAGFLPVRRALHE